MVRVDTNDFNKVALKLKNHDPALYEKFLRLLDAYTYELTVAVTEADANSVLNAQGRAQQGMKFMRLMSEFRDDDGKTVK